jgi:hypothetical protein
MARLHGPEHQAFAPGIQAVRSQATGAPREAKEATERLSAVAYSIDIVGILLTPLF